MIDHRCTLVDGIVRYRATGLPRTSSRFDGARNNYPRAHLIIPLGEPESIPERGELFQHSAAGGVSLQAHFHVTAFRGAVWNVRALIGRPNGSTHD